MSVVEGTTYTVEGHKEDLLAAFRPARRATAGASNPSLSQIRFRSEDGNVWLEASDGTASLETQVSTSAIVDGDFDVQVHTRIVEMLKALPDGEVTLKFDGNQMEVTGVTRAKYRLPLHGHKRPPIDVGRGMDWDNVPEAQVADVIEALDDAKDFASTNVQRPNLNGVSIKKDGEDFVVSSTDTYRLFQTRVPAFGDLFGEAEVTIPTSMVRELKKVFGRTIKLAATDRTLYATDGTSFYAHRRIEGKFPDVDRLFPSEYEHEILVPRDELLDALERVDVVIEGNKPVELVFEGSDLEVSIDTTLGRGEEHVSLGQEVPDRLRIGFNHKYLTEGVDLFKGVADVRFSIVNALRPMLIDTPNGVARFLIIPVRLP